ncbi:MAG: cardiolipin synthase [Erysipelotrichia bacterium]|nr:cardiolipin synthase [Erysipelotrichia bacterium]NCC54980.1 cardiolipin synthase [Erysipelotrichia bacterium]
MLKKLFKLLSNKLFIVAVLIIAQFAILMLPAMLLNEYSIPVNNFFRTLSIILAIYIAARPDNPTYRLTWIMLILVSPVLGCLMYFVFGAKKVPKALRVRDSELAKTMNRYLDKEVEILKDLKENDANALKQSRYISNASQFPIYKHTSTKFFSIGEEQFEEMIKQLRSAKSFIFMEFFIIDYGYMWTTILDILKQKVEEGVDVRLIYDDFGTITTFEPEYHLTLNEMGIKTKVFNPIKPKLAIQMNNRDHRKILVVDGRVAMTGGINIADEYINKINRFGHWKDCGCLIEGEGVWSFTLMFLQFWNFDEKRQNKDDYNKFRLPSHSFDHIESDGYVQPFSDSPTDDENVGESTHINIINNASDYIYITTPYLVLDQETKTSLILASKNGVDVRILVPHIPDKWYVFALTRHNYTELTKHGVRIYEYTPGFVHAKTFVADDKYAIVGTTNMDYRSYYLHYECGVWFYKSSLIQSVKEDYLKTIKISQEITYNDCMKVKLPVRMIRAVLNLLAPLM